MTEDTVQAVSIESISIKALPDGRVDVENAAAYCGMSMSTLAMHRSNGTGPKFVKRGRVFYYLEDLDEWLRAGRVESTAQARQVA